MLELIPTGGLCNKMRAIESAISFCTSYNIPLKVYWIKNKDIINCKFKDMFLPIDNIELYELENLPYKLKKGTLTNLYGPSILRKLVHQGKVFKRYEIKALKKEGCDFKKLYDENRKHLVFFTFSSFFGQGQNYQKFIPNSGIQSMIDEETQQFNDSTIGVHIRRTDHPGSKKISTTDLFEEHIEKELSIDSKVNFYIASDCLKTKENLVNKYGNRIQTNLNYGDRTSLDGMQKAMIELYALSRTTKVYGSWGSSFSSTACLLTGIELITVQ